MTVAVDLLLELRDHLGVASGDSAVDFGSSRAVGDVARDIEAGSTAVVAESRGGLGRSGGGGGTPGNGEGAMNSISSRVKRGRRRAFRAGASGIRSQSGSRNLDQPTTPVAPVDTESEHPQSDFNSSPQNSMELAETGAVASSQTSCLTHSAPSTEADVELGRVEAWDRGTGAGAPIVL